MIQCENISSKYLNRKCNELIQQYLHRFKYYVTLDFGEPILVFALFKTKHGDSEIFGAIDMHFLDLGGFCPVFQIARSTKKSIR